MGVRRVSSGCPLTASGWKSWSAGSVRTTGPVAFCVTARAVRCGSILRSDIVEMLKETLPRKPEGKNALVARINERHSRRHSAIASRFRKQRNLALS